MSMADVFIHSAVSLGCESPPAEIEVQNARYLLIWVPESTGQLRAQILMVLGQILRS
jgi:hypothetical protein